MADNQNQNVVPTQTPLTRDLSFLVIQTLREEGLHESARSVERNSGVYFDLRYIEKIIITGAWNEAEWYITGYFTNIQQSRDALKILFEINRQKYIETLLRKEFPNALEILRHEVRPLVPSDDDTAYQELSLLLSLDENCQNQLAERWGNLQQARNLLWLEVKKILLECRDLRSKLNFPSIHPFRLRSLLSQSFDWQHHLCLRKQPNPVMTTLLQDHNCAHSEPEYNVPISHAAPSRPEGANGTSTSEGALHFKNN